MIYILPFDHRGSFMKIIRAKSPPSKKDVQKAKQYKKIIYQAFKKSLLHIPKKQAAILVDEWLGKSILTDAKKRKIVFCNTFEKSGQKEFQFERTDWKKQLQEIKPNYAKILIRYSPKDKELNLRQAKKLAEFSKYLKNKTTKFLLEVLVLTPESTRPKFALQAIKQLQKQGVRPDIWKLEGINRPREMKRIAKQVKSQIVILGRGENQKKAEHWVKVAAKFKKVIGFAIGRTIFKKPLTDYNNKRITRQQAVNKISQNYLHFVKIFQEVKDLQ
ncbi:DUF2090 domain-containing protein [Candidatus Woesearchaeota archaeon]|nr:DUF2090 domain-containing protein [Candidatus Woesearchaeota archaeon]